MLFNIHCLSAILLFLLTAVAAAPVAEANSLDCGQNFVRGDPDGRRSENVARGPPDWRRSQADTRGTPDWRRSEIFARGAPDWRRSENDARVQPDWRRSGHALEKPSQ